MSDENEKALRKSLLLLPRADRARAQRQRCQFIINGRMVKRLTRRYWLVEGNEVRLDKAVEALPHSEAA